MTSRAEQVHRGGRARQEGKVETTGDDMREGLAASLVKVPSRSFPRRPGEARVSEVRPVVERSSPSACGNTSTAPAVRG